MSTLQVKGGSGPEGRNLKTLNNRNNLANLYMRKQIDHLNRQNSFNIYQIDRHKIQNHELLQRIQRTDSDKHPSAIKYLEKTDSKCEIGTDSISNVPVNPVRRRRKRKSRKVSPMITETLKNYEKEVTSEEHIVNEMSKNSHFNNEGGLDRQKTFCVRERTSESSVTTLPLLDRRGSVYFQIASGNAAGLSSDSDDDEEPTLAVKTRDLSTRRRSSFVAWVQGNSADQTAKMHARMEQLRLRDNPLEQKRHSFANFLKRVKDSKESTTPMEQLQDISENPTPECMTDVVNETNSSYEQEFHNDMMKSLMLNKHGSRKTVEPLNDRIGSFYKRITRLRVPKYNGFSPTSKITNCLDHNLF